MDPYDAHERAAAAHLRILAEKAEQVLEQARAAREIAERARRTLRGASPPPAGGR